MLASSLPYADRVKHHNVCIRHLSIDTGFKQTEHAISPCYFIGVKIETALKCIFEETVPKFSVNLEIVTYRTLTRTNIPAA